MLFSDHPSEIEPESITYKQHPQMTTNNDCNNKQERDILAMQGTLASVLRGGK